MPRNVTVAMLFSAAFGVITLFTAITSLLTANVALYWLNEHSPSANANVRHLNRCIKYFAVVEFIVAALFFIFSFAVVAPDDPSAFAFLLYLVGSSVLSLIFSAINICWSCVNARTFKALDDFDGVTLSDADYRSLRSEQLGGLLASPPEPEFAAPAPEHVQLH